MINKLFALVLASCLFAGCHSGPVTGKAGETAAIAGSPAAASDDTTPRVTGIGGIFFGSADPAETREWYGKNLGLAIDDYGSPFEFRNANDPGAVNYLRWSRCETGSGFFEPSGKEFMINYRVEDLQAVLAALRAEGCEVDERTENSELGKFGWVMDSEGNRIELWQPPEGK